MKKRLLSVLVCLCMILTLTPMTASAEQVRVGKVTVDGTKIYANGTSVTIDQVDRVGTVLYYVDSGTTQYIGSNLQPTTDSTLALDISGYDIYGGSCNTDVDNTDITIEGGTVGSVDGGCYDDSCSVNVHSNIVIKGGTVSGAVTIGCITNPINFATLKIEGTPTLQEVRSGLSALPALQVNSTVTIPTITITSNNKLSIRVAGGHTLSVTNAVKLQPETDTQAGVWVGSDSGSFQGTVDISKAAIATTGQVESALYGKMIHGIKLHDDSVGVSLETITAEVTADKVKNDGTIDVIIKAMPDYNLPAKEDIEVFVKADGTTTGTKLERGTDYTYSKTGTEVTLKIPANQFVGNMLIKAVAKKKKEQTAKPDTNDITAKEIGTDYIQLNRLDPASNASDALAEYSMDGGQTWTKYPEFTGLNPGEKYSFWARYAETNGVPSGDYAAGEMVGPVSFTTVAVDSAPAGGAGNTENTGNTAGAGGTDSGSATGDDSNMLPWILLAATALMVGTGTLLHRKTHC